VRKRSVVDLQDLPHPPQAFHIVVEGVLECLYFLQIEGQDGGKGLVR
jgi:hypothetical protein